MKEIVYVKGIDECDYCTNRSVLADYYRFSCPICRNETLICEICRKQNDPLNRKTPPMLGNHFRDFHKSVDIT